MFFSPKSRFSSHKFENTQWELNRVCRSFISCSHFVSWLYTIVSKLTTRVFGMDLPAFFSDLLMRYTSPWIIHWESGDRESKYKLSGARQQITCKPGRPELNFINARGRAQIMWAPWAWHHHPLSSNNKENQIRLLERMEDDQKCPTHTLHSVWLSESPRILGLLKHTHEHALYKHCTHTHIGSFSGLRYIPKSRISWRSSELKPRRLYLVKITSTLL